MPGRSGFSGWNRLDAKLDLTKTARIRHLSPEPGLLELGLLEPGLLQFNFLSGNSIVVSSPALRPGTKENSLCIWRASGTVPLYLLYYLLANLLTSVSIYQSICSQCCKMRHSLVWQVHLHSLSSFLHGQYTHRFPMKSLRLREANHCFYLKSRLCILRDFLQSFATFVFVSSSFHKLIFLIWISAFNLTFGFGGWVIPSTLFSLVKTILKKSKFVWIFSFA